MSDGPRARNSLPRWSLQFRRLPARASLGRREWRRCRGRRESGRPGRELFSTLNRYLAVGPGCFAGGAQAECCDHVFDIIDGGQVVSEQSGEKLRFGLIYDRVEDAIDLCVIEILGGLVYGRDVELAAGFDNGFGEIVIDVRVDAGERELDAGEFRVVSCVE